MKVNVKVKGLDLSKTLSDLAQRCKDVDGAKIVAGVQQESGENRRGTTMAADDTMMKIAHIHEYGGTIKAKGKYLAIPMSKKAYNKSPRDFPKGFFLDPKKGDYLFYCIQTGEKFRDENGKLQQGLDFLFYLTPSVNMPPRPYIAPGREQFKKKKGGEHRVMQYLEGKVSKEDMFKALGQIAIESISDQMGENGPALSPTYAKLKGELGGSERTLILTGALRDHITYRIEE